MHLIGFLTSLVAVGFFAAIPRRASRLFRQSGAGPSPHPVAPSMKKVSLTFSVEKREAILISVRSLPIHGSGFPLLSIMVFLLAFSIGHLTLSLRCISQ